MQNFIQIPKCIENNTNLSKYKTSNLTIRVTDNDVDTNVDSIRQTWNTNIIRINSGIDSEGGVFFNFPYLEVGDYIILSCEIMSISGTKPILKIAEYNITTNEEYNPAKIRCEKTEWHQLTLKVPANIFKQWYNMRAFIGLESGESGIFQIRGVRAIAYTKTCLPKIERKDYFIELKKDTNGVAISNKGDTNGISCEITNDYLLKITYPSTSNIPVALYSHNKTKQFIMQQEGIPNLTTVTYSFGDLTGKLVSDINTTLPSDWYGTVYLRWN